MTRPIVHVSYPPGTTLSHVDARSYERALAEAVDVGYNAGAYGIVPGGPVVLELTPAVDVNTASVLRAQVETVQIQAQRVGLADARDG